MPEKTQQQWMSEIQGGKVTKRPKNTVPQVDTPGQEASFQEQAAEVMPLIFSEAKDAKGYAECIKAHPQARDTPQQLLQFAKSMDSAYRKLQAMYLEKAPADDHVYERVLGMVGRARDWWKKTRPVVLTMHKALAPKKQSNKKHVEKDPSVDP